MSANNGIYILKTPIGDGDFEYRVAHCQAIENITDEHSLAIYHAVLYFGNSMVYKDVDIARAAAFTLEGNISFLEYGISSITPGFDGPFPTHISREGACKEIERFHNGD